MMEIASFRLMIAAAPWIYKIFIQGNLANFFQWTETAKKIMIMENIKKEKDWKKKNYGLKMIKIF